MEYVEFEYQILDELVGKACNYCTFEFEGEVYELIYRPGENQSDAIANHILTMKNLGVTLSAPQYNQ